MCAPSTSADKTEEADDEEVAWERCCAKKQGITCDKWRMLETAYTGKGKFTCARSGARCTDVCDECDLNLCICE